MVLHQVFQHLWSLVDGERGQESTLSICGLISEELLWLWYWYAKLVSTAPTLRFCAFRWAIMRAGALRSPHPVVSWVFTAFKGQLFVFKDAVLIGRQQTNIYSRLFKWWAALLLLLIVGSMLQNIMLENVNVWVFSCFLKNILSAISNIVLLLLLITCIIINNSCRKKSELMCLNNSN